MPFPNRQTQFKPGNPGGPGRPRTRPITERLREELERADGNLQTAADRVVKALIREAEGGNIAAMKEIINRTEGRCPHEIKVDADVHHRDADLPMILGALGLGTEHPGLGIEAATGSIEPGGAGGSAEPGEVEVSRPSEDPEREAALDDGGDPGGPEPEAGGHDAAPSRKKRTWQQVFSGLVFGPKS
jgi:hypothetical protein